MFCVCERGQTIVIVFLLMYVYHICHSILIYIRYVLLGKVTAVVVGIPCSQSYKTDMNKFNL